MKWTPGDRGSIEDMRGSSGMRVGAPLGIGGLLIVLLLSWATGVDFLSLLSGGGSPPSESVGTTGTSGTVATTPEEERVVDFVGAVLDDAQGTWRELLGSRYQNTHTVLFRDAIQSACGFAQSATGPFYCPADRKVYLDLSFFDELRRRFRAPGDFAQAYVLAHELGHHVQTLLGTDARLRQLESSSPSRRNEISVRMELQADCYAGVWGHQASRSGRAAEGKVELEEGDIDEALNAASAIGDDRIQRQTTGRIVPDSFTHGSSEQRVTWFRRGFQSGDPQQCNTFQQGTN
jgi:predicted metalloprotease